jgi:AcrR family transcriptional regulator
MSIQERKDREKTMRRQQIQNAAKELFILKGFHSTTIEEIAQKAELSPATIYLYFKNKDELYANLNIISMQYLFDRIENICKNKRLSCESKIIKIKDAMYDTFRYDPLILRNIFHIQLEDALPSLSKELLDQVNDISWKVLTIISNVYEEGVRQGKFRGGLGIAHADIIWSTFTGLVIWEEAKRKIDPRKDFLKATLDLAFDIFCRGIIKK